MTFTFFAHIINKYFLRPILNVHFHFSKSFVINFDFKYFYVCYIILDAKYMNELSFKYIFVKYNFYQVLYNTNKNIYGQN